MKPALFALMFLATLTACQPDCDYDPLYSAGYAAGVECEDWITLWDEADGQCAADALADGYNDARAESGEDCDAGAAGVAPSTLRTGERSK